MAMALNLRWKSITESQFAWERDALEYIRERLPDHEPWRAWSNFEFISHDGRVSEIDLLVLSPRGCFLVEIKSRPGVLSGDAASWTWTHAGRKTTDDNPLLLADRKAKKLASLLREKISDRSLLPFIEPLVFCPEVTEVQLAGTARTRLCLRDRPAKPDKPERPGIIRALTERIGDGLDPNYDRIINAPVARAVSKAMEAIGIAPSRRSQQVSDYRLGDLLAEGPAFQDRLGVHTAFENDRRRVRMFITPRGATADAAAFVARAAEREYQILRGLNHPGILKPTSFIPGEGKPAILFEYAPSAVRLDHFIRENHDMLAVDHRLSLLRQIAEAVSYAHQRRVAHHGLCPQSILVLNPDTPQRSIQIFNWQVGSRDGTGSTTAALQGHSANPTISATSHVEQLLDDAASVYRAPEGIRGEIDGIGEHLDIFSLGCLTYFLFSGQPPAASPTDLAQSVVDGDGLRLSAVVDGADERLQDAVRFSTRPLPSDRYARVDEFLDELTRFEDRLTTPNSEPLPDPLDAKAGDRIEHGFVLKKRLGTGSTATALLVTQESDGSEHVLKVARNLSQNDRLRAEAAVLKRLHHQHIVTCRSIYEFKALDGFRVGLLLQNVGETTLGKKIDAEGRIQVEFLERFGEDLLTTLQYLEDNGVFHRDLKPDNIGVSEVKKGGKRHLILFDFSLSSSPADVINAGTPQYIDPFLQDKSRRKYDSHAERFAATVTLYQMATGALPKWAGGVSDPFVSNAEVIIDGNAIESAIREPLAAFIRRGLARNIKDRFDNTQAMLKAWREVFVTAGQPALPAAADALDAPDTDDASADVLLLRGLDRATGSTSLIELGLSTRAINALERIDIHTVKQFLSINFTGWTKLPGVGFKTKTELRRAYAQLQAKFPEIKPREAGAAAKARTAAAAAAVETGTLAPALEDLPGIKSIDVLAKRFAGKRSDRATTEQRAIPMLLGLSPGEVSSIWPSHAEVAAVFGSTRALISQIVGRRRETWRKDSLLTEVRTEVTDLLNAKGGVMTAGELANALLATHGSASTEPVRTSEAFAVLRAAVEAESDRKDEPPRFIIQRIGGHAALRTPEVERAGGHILIARSEELADFAIRLAAKAEQLAQADPLPSPNRVAADLGSVKPPSVAPGIPVPDEVRRIHLAAAASATAAVNEKLEFYPRALPARRALKLAFGAVLGSGDVIKVQNLKDRVRSRYPLAQPLPDMPELEQLFTELAAESGVTIQWDPAADKNQGAFRIVRSSKPTLSSGTAINRQHTLQDAPAQAAADALAGGFSPAAAPRKAAVRPLEQVDADIIEGVLQNAYRQGAYLVLTTEPRFLTAAEAELQRRFPGLVILSVEALLLAEMKAFAAAHEVDWSVVLAADNAERGSQDWRRLLMLVASATPAVERAIRSAAAIAPPAALAGTPAGTPLGTTVLLTNLDVLGRYEQMPMLASLQQAIGITAGPRAPGIHGLWMLLPTDEQNLPTLSPGTGASVAVPVMSGQHRRLPIAWIRNQHRAGQTMLPTA